jgi:hypothetical protein
MVTDGRPARDRWLAGNALGAFVETVEYPLHAVGLPRTRVSARVHRGFCHAVCSVADGVMTYRRGSDLTTAHP